MVDALIASAALPCARCAIPSWTPRYGGIRLFMSQALSPNSSWDPRRAILPEHDEQATD